MFVQIIVTLIVGTIIGFLGKLVAPGDKDNIPIWLTILCGIGGAFVGSFLYYALFGTSGNYNGDMFDTTKGPDWWRHVWQIGVAAILVMLAATITGRRRTTTRV